MPQRIGPDLLRVLDRMREQGRIDQATYDAERADVMEDIRRGRDLGYRPWEKVAFWVVAVLGVVMGVGAILLLTLPSIIIGVLLLLAGGLTASRLIGAPTI